MKGRAAANLWRGSEEVEAHWPDTQRWNQLADRNEQKRVIFLQHLTPRGGVAIRMQPGRWR